MATIDLKTAVPEMLAETASLPDLLEAVKGVAAWDDRQAQVLDHVYGYRTAKLLRVRDAGEEIEALIAHLDRVCHPRRQAALDSLDKPYASRWRAYIDLLDARLHAIQSPAPEMVKRRKHVQEILDLMVKQGVNDRKTLKQRLGLKDANLTRLLNLMEANELIELRSAGREKEVVIIGPNAGVLQPPRKESTEPTIKRGLGYWELNVA